MSKPHACYICNRAFTRKYALRRHLENVHGEALSTDGDERSEMEYNAQVEHYEPCIKSVELKKLMNVKMKNVQWKRNLTKR